MIKTFSIVLIFLSITVNDISCGGGNKEICWFYQSSFDQSLRTFSRVTSNWVQHVINLMQTYTAQNPFEESNALSASLNDIVSKNSGMFTTYLNNFAKEISDMTESNSEIVAEAFNDKNFAAPFPLSCISNLHEASKVYNNALKKVDDEKATLEHTSHALD